MFQERSREASRVSGKNDREPANEGPLLTTALYDLITKATASDRREPPIVREPLGGASGTFERMLEAADEGMMSLPLWLGLAVVDEVRLTQTALDHCQIFLERIKTDYSDNIEYRAARALVTAATLQAKPQPELPAEADFLTSEPKRRRPEASSKQRQRREQGFGMSRHEGSR